METDKINDCVFSVYSDAGHEREMPLTRAREVDASGSGDVSGVNTTKAATMTAAELENAEVVNSDAMNESGSGADVEHEVEGGCCMGGKALSGECSCGGICAHDSRPEKAEPSAANAQEAGADVGVSVDQLGDVSSVNQAKPQSAAESCSRGRTEATNKAPEGQRAGVSNLRQYADPAGHAAAIAERNRTEPAGLIHGLWGFKRGGGVRCLDSTCPMIQREQCEFAEIADKGACMVVSDYEERRFEQVMAIDWIRPTDAPTARVLIKNEILIGLCESWFMRSGHFKRRKGENPAIGIYQTALRAYAAAADALGLNPAARQRLGLDALRGETLMSQIMKGQQNNENTENAD
ncbi:MAG TPA: hypothetical protein PKH33_12700 [bacterium]|nr:hypothetical protein [bacterium]